MRKKISYVFVWQSSKVMAIVACIVSAIYAIPLGIYALVQGDKEVAEALFFQPLVHLGLSFITGLIVFFLYNQIVKVFGGIEIMTIDKDIPS